MAAGSPSSVTAERIPGGRGPGVPLLAGARLPLGFIGFGLAMLAGAVLLTLLRPDLLLLPAAHPQVVALVHLWLPGFLLSTCLGAVYQLMPVVLGQPLQTREAHVWVHLALQIVGVPLLVGGFWWGRFDWVAAGGALVALGLAVLSLALFRTFRSSPRRDAAAWSFPLAGGWLATTVLLGVALALHRKWPFLPWSVVDLLRAHAHLGLVGFFLSLLQGVTFQLVPMFTMGTLARPRLVWCGLLATQAGLLALVPGLAFGQAAWQIIGGSVLLTGILCSALALRATLQTRRRRHLEPGLRAFVAGASCLAAAAIVGLALRLAPSEWEPTFSASWVYGLLIVVGGLALTVLGMLCKIIPFLVWMRAYGRYVGKQPVPTATTLASAPLERAWLRLHIGALVVLVTGLVWSSAPALTVGAVLLAAAVGCLLLSFAGVARHLLQPRVAVVPAAAFPS